MREFFISSSLLIAAILLIRSLFRGKVSARIIYALWLLAAARLLLPISLITVPITVQREARPQAAEVYYLPTVETDEAEVTPSEPVKPAAPRISPETVLKIVWLTGTGVTGAAFIVSNLVFRRGLRKTRQEAEIEGCGVPVYISGAVNSPCLFGLVTPAIYLTEESAGDEERLSYILAHELTHLRHRDNLWALLRCVLAAVYWFDPFVWAAAVASRRDAEFACDEGVIRSMGEESRVAYGIALVELSAGKVNPFAAGAGISLGRGGLKERVKLIVKKKRKAPALAALLIVLSLAATACAFTTTETVYEELEPAQEETEPISDGRGEEALNISDTASQDDLVAARNDDLNDRIMIPLDDDGDRIMVLVRPEEAGQPYERIYYRRVRDSAYRRESEEETREAELGPEYIWPLEAEGRITGHFGFRIDAATRKYIPHSGIDIGGVGEGANVLAAKLGIVKEAGYNTSDGNYILIDHGDGSAAFYSHLSEINVSAGEAVEQGRVIGATGSTGAASGPHLHFEIRIDGTPVDPTDYLPIK